MIDTLFGLLDNWRNLPSYQLERRADIFFALYLPDIIRHRFNKEIDHIIPEFPVRIGNIYEKEVPNPNLSFKIDYLLVSESAKTVFLVELKTDDGSRRDKQDWYLQQVKKKNIPDLVDGVLKIYAATSYKKKYRNLLRAIENIGWLNGLDNTAVDYEIEIVYLQPNGTGSDIIDFDYICEVLAGKEDAVSRRFGESLLRWKQNPAK